MSGERVLVVADVNEDGYGFETPDGAAYGAATVEEAVALAERLGYVAVVESD